MKKIFTLLFLLVITSGCTLSKKTIENGVQYKSANLQKEETKNINSSIVKFVNKDFKLFRTETINYGRAFHYSADKMSFDSKNELIINKYDEGQSAKDLANGIISAREKEEGTEIYSPFIVPDKNNKDTYYITESRIIQTEGPFIGYDVYLIKVFESDNRIYSLIYRESVINENQNAAKKKTTQWIIDNAVEYGSALDKIDVLIIDQLADNNSEVEKISYSDVVNSKDSDLYKFIGKKITWKGKVAVIYSQIDGIKFCIVDDKHINPDVHTTCDWFWAIPPELATEKSPENQPDWNGYWNEFVFKKYSDIDFNKINFDIDSFLITGLLEEVDFNYSDRPVPVVEVIKSSDFF